MTVEFRMKLKSDPIEWGKVEPVLLEVASISVGVEIAKETLALDPQIKGIKLLGYCTIWS